MENQTALIIFKAQTVTNKYTDIHHSSCNVRGKLKAGKVFVLLSVRWDDTKKQDTKKKVSNEIP